MNAAALHAVVSPRTYLIFELVKLDGESPEEVAKELGVRRNVIDNTIFKAMKKLREISPLEEIQSLNRPTAAPRIPTLRQGMPDAF